MGYWLARSQTGRGLMTAAVKALISQGFQQLELNRIQARVATGNYPSQAVCDRLGLKKEGVLRQAEWLYDHYVDLTMNSVLRTEWKEQPCGGELACAVATVEPQAKRNCAGSTTSRFLRSSTYPSATTSRRAKSCSQSDSIRRPASGRLTLSNRA